ncbi:MAG: EamA family transporter [Rhodobacteraceae bacterium]|mgnify:CR=1 FL=1|nr:EamA family transporter [Paracoccaceae bacterium]
MSDPKLSKPLFGVFWMVLTGLLFVLVTAIVKYLGTSIPAVQAAFLRYALGLVLLLPMLPRVRRTIFCSTIWKLALARGVFHSVGVALWFYAMARIPIADVTAMNYLAPVYVTLGAALFLGESLAFRRILAILAALIGALIILRPGFREVGSGHYAMLIAAVVFAASYILAKRLSDLVAPAVIVVMLSIFVPIGLAPLAFLVWVPPTNSDIALLFIVAIIATLGHYTMSLAFKAAPVAMTQPVTFLQLIWAVLLGAFVFYEPFDVWVICGGLVIIFAISFISWREAYLKRQLLTPPAPATKL